MLILKIEDVFISEDKENWGVALSQYKELYYEKQSSYTAIHFAFLCWYILWQWDEISFRGESLTPYEKPITDTRCGISRNELFDDLEMLSRNLLNTKNEIEIKYLMVLCHMKQTYSYFFEEEVFSERDCQQIKKQISMHPFNETGMKVLCTYLHTKCAYKVTLEERMAVHNLFPMHSLMQTYFDWLFDR
ncbi:hypothetical protein P261_00079 [Lachnospiraceae bacterium TWA4]|nr:hypothetical protein P261_00079 [Lachnospiraceae bacterium TWA4]